MLKRGLSHGHGNWTSGNSAECTDWSRNNSNMKFGHSIALAKLTVLLLIDVCVHNSAGAGTRLGMETRRASHHHIEGRQGGLPSSIHLHMALCVCRDCKESSDNP